MRPAVGVLLGFQVASVAIILLAPLSIAVPTVLVFALVTIIGLAWVIWQLRQTEEHTNRLVETMMRYEQAAVTDALTGIMNRRGGEESISHHAARCRRLGTAFSFILVDIDHFKSVNDTHGHATGDAVLAGVSSVIKSSLRASDFAVRWGGEEFLVCLPDTDLTGAIMVAEKLRFLVEAARFGIGRALTISLGCSELTQETFHVALARADMNLYFAKTKGRNQVYPTSVQKMLDRSAGLT